MSDPPVVSLAQSFQSQLRAADEQAILHMAKRWGSIESRLQGLINDLADEIAALQAQGVAVPQWKLYEMERYQALVAQVGREMAMYQQWAFTQIKDDARRSQQAAKEYAQASMFEQLGKEDAFAQIRAMWDRLRTEPTEKIAALAQGGMPLNDILARAYPAAVEAMTERLLSGAALGWHPRKTAQVMMRGGLDQGLNHILLVARDQQIRNYREATRDAFKASGVIYGYKRICAKNDRTCMACLALDGRIYPTLERMQIHPQDRCSMIPLIAGRPEPKWETGLEWFRKQDPGTQKKMMGTGRWNLWQERGFKLRQMVTVKEHPIWGANALETSLKDLKHGRGGLEDGPDFETMRNIYRGIIVEPPERKVIDLNQKNIDLLSAVTKSASAAELDPKTLGAITAVMAQIQKGKGIQGMAVSDKEGKISGALAYKMDPIEGIEITRLGFKDQESLQAALQQVAQVSLSQPSPLGIKVRVPDDYKLDYLKMGWDIEKTIPPAHTQMRLAFHDVQAFHDDPLELGKFKAAQLADLLKPAIEDPTKTVTFQTGYDLPNMPYVDSGLKPGVDQLDEETIIYHKSTYDLGIDLNPLKVDPGKHPAAGMILFDPTSGKFVLTQPTKGYGGYTTTIPKGTVEAGEDPQTAAIREVWEETGMLPKIMGSLGDYTKTTSNNRIYIGVVTGGQPWDAHYETTAVHLIPPDQLAKYLGTKADAKIADDFMATYEKAKELGDGDWLAGMVKLEAQKLEHAKAQNAHQEEAYKLWANEWADLDKSSDQIRMTEAALAWAKKQDPEAIDPELGERWGELAKILEVDLMATKAVEREAAKAVGAEHAKYNDLHTDYIAKGPSALDTVPLNDLKALVEWQKTARLAPEIVADTEAIYNARLEKERLAKVLEFPPEVANGTKAQMVAYITQQTGVAKWKINQRSKRTIEALNGQTYGDALDAAEEGAQKFYAAKNAKKQPYEAEPEPEGYHMPQDVKDATKAKIVSWVAQETGATTWKLKQMSKDELLALDGMTKRQILNATEGAAEKFYEAKKANKPQEDPNSPHVIAKNLDTFPGLATEWTGKQYKEIVTAYMRLAPEDLVGVDTGEIMKLAGLPQDQAQAKLNVLIQASQLEKIVAEYNQQPFGKGGPFLAKQPIHVLEQLAKHPSSHVADEAEWQLKKRLEDPGRVDEEAPEGKAELLKIQKLKMDLAVQGKTGKTLGDVDPADLAALLTLDEIKAAQKYANQALQPQLAALYNEKILAGAGGKDEYLELHMEKFEATWMGAPDSIKANLQPSSQELAEYIAKNSTNTILANQMKSHLAAQGVKVGPSGQALLEGKALDDQLMKILTGPTDTAEMKGQVKGWLDSLDQDQLQKLHDYQLDSNGEAGEWIIEALDAKKNQVEPGQGHDVAAYLDTFQGLIQEYKPGTLAFEKAIKTEFTAEQMEVLADYFPPTFSQHKSLKGWAEELKAAQADEDITWIDTLKPQITPGQENTAWLKMDELSTNGQLHNPEAWQTLSLDQLEFLKAEIEAEAAKPAGIWDNQDLLAISQAVELKETGSLDPKKAYSTYDQLYYGADLSIDEVASKMSIAQLEAAKQYALQDNQQYDASVIQGALDSLQGKKVDEDLPDWLKPDPTEQARLVQGHEYTQEQMNTAGKIFNSYNQEPDYNLAVHSLEDLQACLVVAKDNLASYPAESYPDQNKQLQIFTNDLVKVYQEQALALYQQTIQKGVAAKYSNDDMVNLIKATMTPEQLAAAKEAGSDLDQTIIDHYLSQMDVRIVNGQPKKLEILEASTKFGGPLHDALNEAKDQYYEWGSFEHTEPQVLVDALAYLTVHGNHDISAIDDPENKELAILMDQELAALGYQTSFGQKLAPGADLKAEMIKASAAAGLWPKYKEIYNALESGQSVSAFSAQELADGIAYITAHGALGKGDLTGTEGNYLDIMTEVLQEKGYYTPYHALKGPELDQPALGPTSIIEGYASKSAWESVKLKIEYGHNLAKNTGSHQMADALAYITAGGAVDPAAMDPADIENANKIALALQEQGYTQAYWKPKAVITEPPKKQPAPKDLYEIKGEYSVTAYYDVLKVYESGKDLNDEYGSHYLAAALAYTTDSGAATKENLSPSLIKFNDAVQAALLNNGYYSPHWPKIDPKASSTVSLKELEGEASGIAYDAVLAAMNSGADLTKHHAWDLADAIAFITDDGYTTVEKLGTLELSQLDTIAQALQAQGYVSPHYQYEGKGEQQPTGQAAIKKMDTVLQGLSGTHFDKATDLEKAVADQMSLDELKLAVEYAKTTGGNKIQLQIAEGALQAKKQALDTGSSIDPGTAYAEVGGTIFKKHLSYTATSSHKILAESHTQAELEAAKQYAQEIGASQTIIKLFDGALAQKGQADKAAPDEYQPHSYANLDLVTKQGVEKLEDDYWDEIVKGWSANKDIPGFKLTEIADLVTLEKAAQRAIEYMPTSLGSFMVHAKSSKGFESSNLYQAIHDALIERGSYIPGMEKLNIKGIPVQYSQDLTKIIVGQKLVEAAGSVSFDDAKKFYTIKKSLAGLDQEGAALGMSWLVLNKNVGDFPPKDLVFLKAYHDEMVAKGIYIPGMEKWNVDQIGKTPEFWAKVIKYPQGYYKSNVEGMQSVIDTWKPKTYDNGGNGALLPGVDGSKFLADNFDADTLATVMGTSLGLGVKPGGDVGDKFHADLYNALLTKGIWVEGMEIWEPHGAAGSDQVGKGTLPISDLSGWTLLKPEALPSSKKADLKNFVLQVEKDINYGGPDELVKLFTPQDLATALDKLIEDNEAWNKLYIKDIKTALESQGYLLDSPAHMPPAKAAEVEPTDLQPEGWKLTLQKLEQNKAWLASHNGLGQPPHKITNQEQLELAKAKPDYFTKEELGYIELMTGQAVKSTGSIPLPDGTSEKGLKYMTNAQLKAHIVDHSAYTLEDLAKLKKNDLVAMIGGGQPKIPEFKPGGNLGLEDIQDIDPSAFKPPTGAIDISGAKPELVEKYKAQAQAAGIGKGVIKALDNVKQGHTVMVYTDDQGNFLGAVSWSQGLQSGALKMSGAGFLNPETTAQGVADAYQAAAKLGLPLYTWVPTTHEAQYKAWGFVSKDSQYHQLDQGLGPLSLTSAVSKNISKQTDLGPLPLPFGAATMADAKAMTKATILDHVYKEVGDITKTDLALLSKPQLLSVIGTTDAKARLTDMVGVAKTEKELTDAWDKFQAGGLEKLATSKEAYKVLDFIDHFKPQDDPKSELTGAQWDRLIGGIRMRADELAEEERNNLPYTPQFRTRPQPRIRDSQAKKVIHDDFPEDPGKLERVSGLGGTTGAELVRDPATGKQYVRKYGNNAGHARTEAYVNNMYREMGINVPKTQLYDEGGKPYILTEYIEGGRDLRSYLSGASATQRAKVERQIQDAFAMDALVGNWDVAGASGDNFLIDASGNLWRIDNGGSLRYRAQGGIKTQEQGAIAWNEYVTEFWTMRGPGSGAKGVTGPLYDRMDWYEIMGQAEDIVKKGEQLLEYVPEEERQILWARLEHMRDMVETSQVMRRDGMLAQFPDSLHRHSANLAQGGWVKEGGDPRRPTVAKSLVDILPKKLSQRGGGVTVYDEHGSAYDGLKGDGPAMSLIHQYMRDNDLDIDWLAEYCGSQGHASSTGPAQAMQYWEWKNRGQPSDGYLRGSGKRALDESIRSIMIKRVDKELAAQHSDWYRMNGRDQNKLRDDYLRTHDEAELRARAEKVLDDTIMAWRAFVVTTLRNTPFKYNNQEQGFVQMVRTEADAGVYGEDGRRLRPDTGTFQTSTSRGLMDSCSIYNWVRLSNNAYIGMAVPYHRIQGFYFHGRPGSTGGYSFPFLGEGENEFVADLTGLEFVYMRHGAGSFRGSTDSAWREVAQRTGRSELDPSNWS